MLVFLSVISKKLFRYQMKGSYIEKISKKKMLFNNRGNIIEN